MQPPTQFTNTSPYKLPDERDGKPIHSVAAKAAPVEYCLYARKSSEDDELTVKNHYCLVLPQKGLTIELCLAIQRLGSFLRQLGYALFAQKQIWQP